MLTNRIDDKMKTITIILCSFVFANSYDHKRCDKNGTLFYESLSCKPRFLKSNMCPHYFDCSTLNESTNNCLLEGRSYKIGEAIEEHIQKSYCKADCSCKRNGDRMDFHCASVDCPEYEDIDSSCYYGYELEYCCSTRKICPPFSNITCKVANNIFKEGEQFYDTNSCSECVCKEGFAGKYTQPFCKRIHCPTVLDNTDVIMKKCAPVYLLKANEPLCCPTTFICPSELKSDLITDLPNTEDYPSCTFGNKTLALGAGFETLVESLGKNRMAKCKCELPTFMTCKVYV